MILLDANIFMYAAGAPHPHKEPSIAFLHRLVRDRLDAAIDAEILQEILHRYRALNRWEKGKEVYDRARRIIPRVIPITAAIMDRTRALLDVHGDLLARDALHAAVYFLVGAEAFCSFDTDFDRIEGLRRREPA